jgi:uroporphyrinogen decarboxylase
MPFALLSAGAWAINRQGITLEQALALSPAQVAEILFEGYTLADSAISWGGAGYHNLVIRALGGTIKWRRSGTPDVTEPLLKSINDIQNYDPKSINDDPSIQFIYETVRELVKLEKGERLVGGSMWGPFTLSGLLYGADALMRGVYKDRDAINQLLQFAADTYLTYLQGYIDAGARVIFMAEPSASGDMISRKHFEGVALPYIKQVYQRLESQDVILGLHICGNTSDRFGLITDCGTQIMSLDYKVDLREAKEAFAGHIAFAGNLDPVAVVQNGTPAHINDLTLASIESVGVNSGFIVMPGCDIPPSTPLENLQAMSAAARSYPLENGDSIE